MKRLSCLLIVLSILIAVGAYAKSITGVGIYGNVVGSGASSYGGGIGASLKFGNFPVLGIEYNLSQPRIGASCDYWVINSHLTGALDYYLGIGGYVGLGLGGNSGIDAGGRIPIGLQMFPVQKLEIFAEAAPTIPLIPTIGIGFSLRIGIRVLF